MRDHVSQFPRVGGTEAGGYYEVAPDVLVALPREGYEQTVHGARASLREFERLAAERGRPLFSVILVDFVRSQDSGSRRVWSDEADPARMAGLALVSSSLLGRAIASFFIGLTRPRVPTQMLPTLDAALVWIEELRGPRER